MPRSEEEAFFENWHEIYTSIRAQLLEKGVVESLPEDTSLIHKTSAVKNIRRDHETKRVFEELPQA